MVQLGEKSLSFTSTGVDVEFDVAKIRSTEELSRCYEYTIDLVTTEVAVDLRALLQQPGSLGVQETVQTAGGQSGSYQRKIHGIVTAVEQLELHSELARYRVVLSPRLWRLSRTRRSRVFQELTVPQIVEEILTEHGVDDFELRLEGTYVEREYVVQYEETDLAFVSRWLEHEGIFFTFEHDDNVEKLVLADATSAYVDIADTAELEFQPQAMSGSEGNDGQDWMDVPEVQTLTCRQDVLPTEFKLDDFNWKTPSVDLTVTAAMDSEGVGAIREFHNHYKELEQGEGLARIRAEELTCREIVFTGTSNCRTMRPGATFTLKKHFRADFNERYVIVTVHHKAKQDVGRGSASSGATYSNAFVAIPADRVFRPERVTPKPRVDGVLNAKVDSSGSGQVAEIDEHGRYKVVFAFDGGTDVSSLAGGQGSRWLRLAQPFAGQNYGMHFPLLKGTEVLVAHVGGDPDRPVILGAVPNAENHTPVDRDNHQRNAIETSKGGLFEMDDKPGQQGLLMTHKRMSAVRVMRSRPKN